MTIKRFKPVAEAAMSQSDNGGYVKYDDYERLAAENAGLKSAAEFSTAEDMWVEQADGMLDYRYIEWYVDVLKAAMETPDTDDFLAEVRASALDEFASALDERDKKYYEISPGCSAQDECQFAAGQAWYFAECIRKGVQS